MRKKGRISKECSRCRGPLEEHRAGVHTYCLKCHACYMRMHRPKHKDLQPLARKKANARAYAHVCRDRGLIDKKPCSLCGSEDSQMHHEDYNKPKEVTWLCRECHLEHHREPKELRQEMPQIPQRPSVQIPQRANKTQKPFSFLSMERFVYAEIFKSNPNNIDKVFEMLEQKLVSHGTA